MVDNSKIAIVSTVINFDLYAKSSQLFPQKIKKYVIDGRNGMYGLDSIFYMMKKLKNKDIEWIIMADEDVLFHNTTVVLDIIDKMQRENYMVAGVRDGGMIRHRYFNPYLINTFFSIINFRELKEIWNKKELLKNSYILNNEFNDNLTTLKEDYDVRSLYEPYYIFFLWLRRKNKLFLFLNANLEEDEITNSVLYNHQLFLYHTWFARAYGINEKHTKRIDKIFNLLNFESTTTISNPIIFKDNTFFLIQKIKRKYKIIVKRLKIKKWSKN